MRAAPSNFSFRSLQPGDRLAPGLPQVRPDRESPPWRRSRVAAIDSLVVGVGVLQLAAATETYFCEITVVEEYRRRGLGTGLYRDLYKLTRPRSCVVARAMSTQPLRGAFAESLGCTVVLHCPSPWVDPTTEPARDWVRAHPVPDGYVVRSTTEVPAAAVRDAWCDYYVWAHEPMGTVHRELIDADGYLGGVDGDLSRLVVDRSSNEVVAFSLVTPNSWQGRTFVVTETVRRDQRDGVDLVAAAVAASLDACADRGLAMVELEGHSTDPHVPPVADSLPPGGGDPMDILALDPPLETIPANL